MTSQTMLRLMSQTASTKRAVVVDGKSSAPVAYLADVPCMPIDPISFGETRDRLQSMGVDSPIALYQTVVEGDYDIVKGDDFSSGGVDYAVRDVDVWGIETAYVGTALKRLILEKVKP
jgi:hypothetical protein